MTLPHLPMEQLLPALLVGLGATVVGRWRPAWTLPLAAVGGVAVLLPSTRAGTWSLAAALLVAGAAGRSGRRPMAVALVGVVAFGVALRDLPPEVLLAGVGAGALHVATGPGLPGRLPRPAPAALVAATVVALWLCAPDTEEVVAVGAALAVPVLAGGLGWRRPLGAILAGRWTPALVALSWAAAQGFRGRPASAVAVVVIGLVVAGWPLAEAAAGTRGRTAPTAVGAPVATIGVLVLAAVAVVVARTAGLATATAAAVLPAAAGAIALLALWGVVSWWGRGAERSAR